MITHTAKVCPNLALVKYWGKFDQSLNLKDLNLPSHGSISVSLSDIFTKTTITPDPTLNCDEITLDGKKLDRSSDKKVFAFLDRLKTKYSVSEHFRVETLNNFPSSAGIASSSSGFAALTLCFFKYLGFDYSLDTLSDVSRVGSGSAARSFIGGWCKLSVDHGKQATKASQIAGANSIPMKILIAITENGPKKISSTQAMKISKSTSPFYPVWETQTEADLITMEEAILSADFVKIGSIAQANAMRMHAVMFTSNPPINYWNERTIAIIQTIEYLQKQMDVFLDHGCGPAGKGTLPPRR